MTEEQKTRIVQAKENDCSFDGMPLHPHHRYYLTKAGFKNISEIEELTEEEFCRKIDLSFDDNTNKRGRRCLKDLKRKGVCFKGVSKEL